MNSEEIATIIKTAILNIAPDADPEELAAGDDMRDELDLDSMDFFNIIVEISEKTGIDIPAADYAQVLTMASMRGYVEKKLTAEAT